MFLIELFRLYLKTTKVTVTFTYQSFTCLALTVLSIFPCTFKLDRFIEGARARPRASLVKRVFKGDNLLSVRHGLPPFSPLVLCTLVWLAIETLEGVGAQNLGTGSESISQ